MSDEPVSAPPAPAPDAGEKTVSVPSEPAHEPSRVFDAFVRGGTTSSLHDAHLAKSIADAEKRREAADADAAKERQGAKIYTNKLTEHGNVPKAYVLLDYLTSRGDPLYDHGVPVQCLADVMMTNPEDPGELTLQLVCPVCLARMPRGSMQFAQLTLRQKHKPWHLDQSTAGMPIMFEGQVYRSAGVVTESESFQCPDCRWTARISKNKVWPD